MTSRRATKREGEPEASPTVDGLNSYQKRALLLSAFGTKAQQRGVEAKLRKQFSFDSATRSILENTFNESDHDQSIAKSNDAQASCSDSDVNHKDPLNSSTSQEASTDADIMPRAHPDAQTVIDVYPLFELISADVFTELEEPASKFLQLCVRQASISENTRIPRFVVKQATRINSLESDFLRDRLSRTLLYVATLVRFYTTTIANKGDTLNYFLEQTQNACQPSADDLIAAARFDSMRNKAKETRRRHGAAQRGFDAATYLFGNGSGKLVEMNTVRIEKLVGHLRDKYTIQLFCDKLMRVQRCSSHLLRDKMLLRILAICLHLSDFSMELDALQKDLQLGTGRISTLLRSLGCSIKRVNPQESSSSKATDKDDAPEEITGPVFVATLTLDGVKYALAMRQETAVGSNGEISERLTNSLLRFGKRTNRK